MNEGANERILCHHEFLKFAIYRKVITVEA
jgi:hypothetical protein